MLNLPLEIPPPIETRTRDPVHNTPYGSDMQQTVPLLHYNNPCVTCYKYVGYMERRGILMNTITFAHILIFVLFIIA